MTREPWQMGLLETGLVGGCAELECPETGDPGSWGPGWVVVPEAVSPPGRPASLVPLYPQVRASAAHASERAGSGGGPRHAGVGS